MSSIATTENISPILAGDDILKPTTQEGTAQEEGTDNKKKSNLPAKFFKSMVFGYWNLMRLKQDSIITEEVYSKALQDYLKPFASVTDQTALYESFENDFKMLSKDLKKMIKDHHKPPKVKKAKVVKEKKVKGDAKLKDDNDIVSRIVEAALTSTEPVEVVVKPKRKYNRKKTLPNTTLNELKTETHDSCLGCESGIDNDSAHRDPNTNNYYPNCCCAPNQEPPTDRLLEKETTVQKQELELELKQEKELKQELELELELEQEEEEERDVQLFHFKDGFTCLYDPNDLSLYDKDSHLPITSHSLQRISLPNNQTVLLDNFNNTY